MNARAAGPRLGKSVQQVIQAARTGNWSEVDGVVTAGGIELAEGQYELALATSQDAGAADAALALLAGGGFALLDTATTPALESEGFARDVIRGVQDTRKSAGFEVSDRIRLDLIFFNQDDADSFARAVTVDVAGETLAVDFTVHSASTGFDATTVENTVVSEWLPAVTGEAVEHSVRFDAQHYVNQGPLIVAVARENGMTNV